MATPGNVRAAASREREDARLAAGGKALEQLDLLSLSVALFVVAVVGAGYTADHAQRLIVPAERDLRKKLRLPAPGLASVFCEAFGAAAGDPRRTALGFVRRAMGARCEERVSWFFKARDLLAVPPEAVPPEGFSSIFGAFRSGLRRDSS